MKRKNITYWIIYTSSIREWAGVILLQLHRFIFSQVLTFDEWWKIVHFYLRFWHDLFQRYSLNRIASLSSTSYLIKYDKFSFTSIAINNHWCTMIFSCISWAPCFSILHILSAFLEHWSLTIANFQRDIHLLYYVQFL